MGSTTNGGFNAKHAICSVFLRRQRAQPLAVLPALEGQARTSGNEDREAQPNQRRSRGRMAVSNGTGDRAGPAIPRDNCPGGGVMLYPLYPIWIPLPRPPHFPRDPKLDRLLASYDSKIGCFELQMKRRHARAL